MAKYVVCDVESIPPGTHLVVTVRGRSIGVFNVDGQFYGLRNSCPHQGGPLCEGQLLGQLRSARPGEYEFDAGRKLLECPWHGWEYDIETGQSWFDPSKTRVRKYAVEVREGRTLEIDPASGLAKGPYVAESYPVSVEKDYVVVEVGE
jgi:nitrite reductase/ring-hydroxylating ferredoxin subunit